jgi:hypothetical protein
MPAYVDLFTPETWQSFVKRGSQVTGFRKYWFTSQIAPRIKPGDVFFCYLVKLGRWMGALNVLSNAYEDSTPYFTEQDDPFTVRFSVETIVSLAPERGIPITAIWDRLPRCRGISPQKRGWIYKVKLERSLEDIDEADADVLIELLRQQAASGTDYPLTAQERKWLEGKRMVSLPTGAPTPVEIPSEEEAETADEEEAQTTETEPQRRRSLLVQANLAKIGIQLGFKIWVAASDRAAVLAILNQEGAENFLLRLPLNADDNTVDTVERIDVLWVRSRTIVRAFEVEDKTAVYSGILRMADLIALQPQFRIKLHIVAPEERRDKVRQQILRPVFSCMEGGPLAKICTYLSYDAVETLAAKKDLQFMRDTIVDEYEDVFE